MATILGQGNTEYLLEDDGRLWSRDKTMEFDPLTYAPFPVAPVVKPQPKRMVRTFGCPECGSKKSKNLTALKRHFFKAHGRVYEEG